MPSPSVDTSPHASIESTDIPASRSILRRFTHSSINKGFIHIGDAPVNIRHVSAYSRCWPVAMTELAEIFDDIGLAQYLDSFREQGFDTWDSILDITELDLDILGVKLGHRRRLQRKIAEARRVSHGHQALASPKRSTCSLEGKLPEDGKGVIAQSSDGKEGSSARQLSGKRKYKKHPKPDENAPARPRSAYVIFSNKMREDLKDKSLSFTEFTKLVGKTWQNLTTSEKEPYEQQAFDAKEKYVNELRKYITTESYYSYSEYLHDFAKLQESSREEPNETSKVPKVDSIPSRQSKEGLLAQVHKLMRRQQETDRIFAALVSEDKSAEVLEKLRSHESLENISKILDEPEGKESRSRNFMAMSISKGTSDASIGGPRASETCRPSPQIGAWNEQGASCENSASTVRWARNQRRGYFLRPQSDPELQSNNFPDVNVWTEVSSDNELIEHLVALYFCWEYPTFAPLDKEHFLNDFFTGTPRFSTQPNVRVDPNDSTTAGDHFFAEALRILEEEKSHHNVTTIQALGLMSVREASCGRSSESIYYADQSVRTAVEMGLHLKRESGGGGNASVAHTVKSATFWGAFALDQAWSISIGRLPNFSKETILMAKPTIVDDIEKSFWVPYTDSGAPLERDFAQTSNVHSVYKSFCELSEIVHKSLYVLFTPGRQWTKTTLLDVYTQFLQCMYYHYAVLLLFRPFIKLSIISSSISPRYVCCQAADAIAVLVRSYSKLYTLQRTPSFMPCIVLTSSIAHLVNLGTGHGDLEKVQRGIADLRNMAICHHFASCGVDMLFFLAYHWGIDLSFVDNKSCSLTPVKKKDPKTLGRPRRSSTNLFAPNVQTDAVYGIFPATEIDENPLFGPFPLQGRPLLAAGVQLEKIGFTAHEKGKDME
ncbi:hypothetical protein O988_00019 [Pseudogymnoascus sp. VKM F-3808]|nr:hypothetical protein O988_00019 [Pseudogymnoascus sp. VKM F-3808]